VTCRLLRPAKPLPAHARGTRGQGAFGIGFAAVLAASAGNAHAAEPSTAEVLFREARELIARGDYAAACPKLEESQRLDPAPGTEFNLARCYELTGRIASAWGSYLDVANVTHAAGQSDREARARERVAAIEPRLSFVTVKMQKATEGAHLTRDGADVALAQLDVAIPIDPGEHVLRALAPLKRVWETHFRIDGDAQRLTVEVPPLEDEPAPAEAATALPVPPTVAPPSDREGRAGAANAPPNPQRIVAVSLLGASAVALGVGVYFGITKISLASRARSDCQTDPCTSPSGIQAIESSNSAGDWSTGAFVSFGVLAAAAGVLWFTAPKHAPLRTVGVTPMMTASGAGLVFRGEWE
jgi:hypothetical protein